jgi:hypothetical protein
MHTFFESLTNKHITAVISVMFLVIGGAFGYSMGLLENVSEDISAPSIQKRVLGTGVSPYYVNPIKEANPRTLNFPIAQLRGCRNWEECEEYCDDEKNYPACASWAHSLE